MTDNWTILTKEFNQHQGELVLDGFQVVELIDLIDGEEDYYWIFNNGRGIQGLSCVGRVIFLKDSLPEEEYNYLRSTFDYNNIYQGIEGEKVLAEYKDRGWEGAPRDEYKQHLKEVEEAKLFETAFKRRGRVSGKKRG
jgi:hypothetical protein